MNLQTVFMPECRKKRGALSQYVQLALIRANTQKSCWINTFCCPLEPAFQTQVKMLWFSQASQTILETDSTLFNPDWNASTFVWTWYGWDWSHFTPMFTLPKLVQIFVIHQNSLCYILPPWKGLFLCPNHCEQMTLFGCIDFFFLIYLDNFGRTAIGYLTIFLCTWKNSKAPLGIHCKFRVVKRITCKEKSMQTFLFSSDLIP